MSGVYDLVDPFAYESRNDSVYVSVDSFQYCSYDLVGYIVIGDLYVLSPI